MSKFNLPIMGTSVTLTGDALVTDVLAGKTFYNTDPDTKLTGTLVAGGDGWNRPTEWLAQPTYTAGQQRLDLLFAVGENAINDIAFNITTAGATYDVDWGDGTSDLEIDSGVNAEHIYDWADISSATLMANGMRQAMITVTLSTWGVLEEKRITGIDLNEKHTSNPKAIANIVSQIMEVNCVGEYISVLTMSSGTSLDFNYLENFYFPYTNLVSNSTSKFDGMKSLKRVESFYTGGMTNMNYMFRNCSSLVTIPLLNTSNVTTMEGMFAECSSLVTIPLLNTGECKNMSGMFNGCSGLTVIPPFDTGKCENMSGMFFGCVILQGKFSLNTALNKNFSDTFEQCDSLTEITVNLNAGTTFNADAFELNYNLAKLTMTNMPSGFTSIDLAQTNLGVDALVAVFNSLYDRSATTAGTIIITSAYGAAGLSAGQRAIATDKNWNITG